MAEEPNESNQKRGLALSGGGFRATLFHLGVIRYLYDVEKRAPETKALSGITHITSVSGGSILAAHLVLNWENYTGEEDDFNTVAQKLIKFVKKDVRGRIVRRLPLSLPLFSLSVLLRRTPFLNENTVAKWTRTTTIDSLRRYYSKHLYDRKRLFNLNDALEIDPDTTESEETTPKVKRPALYLLATTMDGNQAAFTANGFHVYEMNGEHKVRKMYEVSEHEVGLAVAASSAFPGLFTSVGYKPERRKDDFYKLVDGGVYDNLGVRMFWDLSDKAEIKDVIVSDASVETPPFPRRSFLEPLTTPIRAADILFRRVYEFETKEAKQKDYEIKKCNFRFLRLRDELTPNDNRNLLAPHRNELKWMRTDLDRFSDLEIAALVRHGYSIARQELAKNLFIGVKIPSAKELWNPVHQISNETKDGSGEKKKKKKKKSLVEHMLERTDDGDIRERITRELEKSSDRKWRLFWHRDSASRVLIFSLLIILLFVGINIHWIRSKLWSGENSTDIALKLPNKIKDLNNQYIDSVSSAMIDVADESGFKPNRNKNALDLHRTWFGAWTTAESSYALLKARGLNSIELSFIVRSLTSNELPNSQGLKNDWSIPPVINNASPKQAGLRAEPALWTLAAISKVLQQKNINAKNREQLTVKANQIITHLNKFMVRTTVTIDNAEKSASAFHLLPNQETSVSPSAYSTALALLTCLEMRQTNLTWDETGPSELSEQLINWLNQNFDKDRSRKTSPDEKLIGSLSEDAAGLAVVAILLWAHTEFKRDVLPDNVTSAVENYLQRIEGGSLTDSALRIQMPTNQPEGQTQVDEITARYDEVRILLPWRTTAIGMCRQWLKRISNDSLTSLDEKERLLELIDKYLKDLPENKSPGTDDFTIQSAEMLIALS